jgi:superfamily II DNA helicase RecQ
VYLDHGYLEEHGRDSTYIAGHLISERCRRRADPVTQKVRDGDFAVVIVSPELYVEKHFQMFLRFPPGPLDHLACLGAVDVHLFRARKNPYGSGLFEQLTGHRGLLSDHKPFLGTTPTLTDHDRRKVLSDLHLIRSSYMQLSNRRLDLTYVFAPFHDYYALADILEPIPDHLMKMPRTLIYCKDLHELNEVRMFLITVTMSRWPKASRFVAAYHAHLNEKDKGIIEASFRSGRVPVVVATSAFGAVSLVIVSTVDACLIRQ